MNYRDKGYVGEKVLVLLWRDKGGVWSVVWCNDSLLFVVILM